MSSNAKIQQVLQLVRSVEQQQRVVDLPPSEFPSITVEEAYGVQFEMLRESTAAGRTLVGWKVGATSRTVQRMVGMNEPFFGYLLDSMVCSEDEAINTGELRQPLLELEIAFVLKSDLKGPGVTVGKVVTATAGVMAAMEIPDLPLAESRFNAQQAGAFNAFAGRIVLGGRMVALEGIDLRLVGAVLERNGEVIGTAAGASVLGNPVEAVAWLANKLARYDRHLGAGDLVFAGALMPPTKVSGGDYFKGTFDRLGAVSARFSA